MPEGELFSTRLVCKPINSTYYSTYWVHENSALIDFCLSLSVASHRRQIRHVSHSAHDSSQEFTESA
eukprot:COSAG01_NODE_67177_length_267_cov_36.208333_1_plen_66_part_01